MSKTSILLLALSLTFSSCVKGPKGDTGPQGPAGTNGVNGTNGNANVKTGTATILPGDWGFDGSTGLNTVDISYAAITADIVSTGTVSVFFTNTSGNWVGLPYTIWGSPSVTINYAYKVGLVSLSVQNTNLTAQGLSIQVKIVAISSAQMKANPKANWKDYNEVMAIVNNAQEIHPNQ
ncbi:MAG: collagen-like protein [Chitinophagaceae bacterium]|nr:collagen-like protein [Chitinophagaceae bacterium]